MSEPAGKKKKMAAIAVIAGVLLILVILAIAIRSRKAGQPAEETDAVSEAGMENGSVPEADGQKAAGDETSEIGATVAGGDDTEKGSASAEAAIAAETGEPEPGAPKDVPFLEKFGEAVSVTVDENYRPAVDLEEMRKNYPDVIGWLSIPGTNIGDALLQSPVDDTLYLDHDREKKESSAGELFTEKKYNDADFSDPVTVVYGHNMRSGKKFGFLQEYYTGAVDKTGAAEAAKKYETIIVTLPEGELTYRVFAALPFDNRHILASYDFTSPLAAYRFFSEVKKTRALGGSVDRSVTITDTDKVLILSTCMPDHDSRFLVMARLVAAKTNHS